jgi:2-polyprenyl-6-methoxyphenol hydroxylase-like FAD-dependent oxidoreductase
MQSEVLVAGCGVAAAATASRLIDFGYRVSLLSTSATRVSGVEILPPESRAQIEVLGWESVLAAAGALLIEGFENLWNPSEPVVKPGSFLHVERSALARSALAFVARRGATVQHVQQLPRLRSADDGDVLVTLDGVERRFCAAVDATGRAAAWSRPVQRHGRHVTDLFEVPTGSTPLRGRVVRDLAGDRWAYRAGLIDLATIGVVTEGPSHRQLDPSLAWELGVPAESFDFIGRRPSFAQWATEPVLGRRLSVGDAAFASDPLSGQGLRFAMASALAAAPAVDALVRSDQTSLALDYYRDFVISARVRHFRALADLRARRASPVTIDRLPDTLRFIARPRLAALNVVGILAADVAYELSDGSLVRWLGGFDLRRLASLTHDPITSSELSHKLRAEGMPNTEVNLLIAYCLSRNILG